MTSAKSNGKTGQKGEHPPSLAERRERVLDEIALQRIQIRDAALNLMVPIRKIDDLRNRFGGALVGTRQWLYPVAPVLALLVFRMRPRLRSLPSLMARGWSLWRLWKRFR